MLGIPPAEPFRTSGKCNRTYSQGCRSDRIRVRVRVQKTARLVDGRTYGFSHVRGCSRVGVARGKDEEGFTHVCGCVVHAQANQVHEVRNYRTCVGAFWAALPLPRELRLSFHLFKYMNLPAIGCAILQIYTKRHGNRISESKSQRVEKQRRRSNHVRHQVCA